MNLILILWTCRLSWMFSCCWVEGKTSSKSFGLSDSHIYNIHAGTACSNTKNSSNYSHIPPCNIHIVDIVCFISTCVTWKKYTQTMHTQMCTFVYINFNFSNILNNWELSCRTDWETSKCICYHSIGRTQCTHTIHKQKHTDAQNERRIMCKIAGGHWHLFCIIYKCDMIIAIIIVVWISRYSNV